MKENRKLLREVLNDIRHDMTDEEVLNLLADSKISVRPEGGKEKYTLGQRAADSIAKFAGSWAFIFSFSGVLILWMVVNVLLAAGAFDPYPFILLNLVLSCVAAIQAPLIMMSQNRQEEKDRRRAENDYKVNLKTEIMIEDLYDKVNAILAKQSALESSSGEIAKKSRKQPNSLRRGLSTLAFLGICVICSMPRNRYSSAVTVCNGLIDQLLQCFCLFLGGYCTDDRLADDVAVLVNYICSRIGVQSGGEFTCLAFRVKPNVLVGHAFFCQNILCIVYRRFIPVKSE